MIFRVSQQLASFDFMIIITDWKKNIFQVQNYMSLIY